MGLNFIRFHLICKELEGKREMASPRESYIIDIIGSVIQAAEGTATYSAFLKLQDCDDKTYQAFRDLAGGPKGTPARAFSPSSTIKMAEAAKFGRLIPPSMNVQEKILNVIENEAIDAPARWRNGELRAALSAYLEILGRELAGEQTNKLEVNRRL